MLRASLTVLSMFAVFASCPASYGAEPLTVRIVYAEQRYERPPTLSNLRSKPVDQGLAGARLAIIENNTTGKFLGQEFQLVEIIAAQGDTLEGSLAGQPQIVVLNAASADMVRLADSPIAKNKLLFNAGSRDENIREGV
jgi:hypothetical protein